MDYADFLAELQEFMTRMDEVDQRAGETSMGERFSDEELADLRRRLETVIASLPSGGNGN